MCERPVTCTRSGSTCSDSEKIFLRRIVDDAPIFAACSKPIHSTYVQTYWAPRAPVHALPAFYGLSRLLHYATRFNDGEPSWYACLPLSSNQWLQDLRTEF